MKHVIPAIFILITGFVLQTALFSRISFGGIVPNILVLLAAAYGFMYGDKAGLFMGFFGGLMADVFFGSFLGLNAVILMYIGYLNGKFNRFYYEEDIKLPLVLIVVSDLAYGGLYYFVMFLLRGRFDLKYYFMKIMLPELVYTVLVALVYYPLLLLLYRILHAPKNGGDISFV
ncbi:MAG: rod shape-determining protein MreD [Lachnospiraceae bacterium]|nr:rod shape-determining protein MreD [Lachnospiraceae bacterium]